MQAFELRTGVWYHDRLIRLTFPDEWDVAAYWPDTPMPLSDDAIRSKLAAPVGQPPLKKLAVGKKTPVVVVDDTTRPTPVYKIMPFLLEEFQSAGISPSQVRVLVATGTHGPPDEKALIAKLGEFVMRTCRVLVHDDLKHTRLVGRTSFGTPVFVNRELLKSDLIIGVGGVYPQHSTGFGGGGKLALGVLGRRSIKHLHFGHGSVGGNYDIDNDFRRDVTEMARLIGLDSIVTVHVNASLQVVNVTAGDYSVYYRHAAEFSRQRYAAPRPDGADVVIANAYPSDVSYTFMRKANQPILLAPAGATKIIVASNHGGLGHHGLYPQGRDPRWLKYKELWDRVSIMKPRVIAAKVVNRLRLRPKGGHVNTSENSPSPPSAGTLWIYTPEGGNTALPQITGVEVVGEWDTILRIIKNEHSHSQHIKVRIYPCASLQCL